jgi:hypothetical protein
MNLEAVNERKQPEIGEVAKRNEGQNDGDEDAQYAEKSMPHRRKSKFSSQTHQRLTRPLVCCNAAKLQASDCLKKFTEISRDIVPSSPCQGWT